MSLEARVERLESHFDSLDSAVRNLINITGETHQEILATRQEMRTRFAQQDKRFDQQDKRFDKIEDTLAIIVNHLKN